MTQREDRSLPRNWQVALIIFMLPAGVLQLACRQTQSSWTCDVVLLVYDFIVIM